jgi:hypothetical protein
MTDHSVHPDGHPTPGRYVIRQHDMIRISDADDQEIGHRDLYDPDGNWLAMLDPATPVTGAMPDLTLGPAERAYLADVLARVLDEAEGEHSTATMFGPFAAIAQIALTSPAIRQQVDENPPVPADSAPSECPHPARCGFR